MTTFVPRPSGEDWQNWANQLLSCHYGPTEYQKVPDNDRGDAGIEGFTITDGHAFQAYGCEEPISTQERYEKQRNKITADIKKFIENKVTLIKIFGSVKITRWVLLVPHCDSKEIIAHASKKTGEVVAANLPYIGPGFRVVVSQEDDFVVARDQLINAKSQSLQITADETTPTQVTQWATSNDALTSSLESKLLRLPTLATEIARRDFHEQVLKWYLNGQSVLDGLRRYPQVYEKVIKTKSHREAFLVMASIDGRPPQNVLSSSISVLREDLEKEVKELHSFSAEKLAYEAVADWLLRCPLDFPEVPHV